MASGAQYAVCDGLSRSEEVSFSLIVQDGDLVVEESCLEMCVVRPHPRLRRSRLCGLRCADRPCP